MDGNAGFAPTAASTFVAVVVAQLRRELIGPWPGDPPGAVLVRGVAELACAEPDTVLFGLDLLVHGIAVSDSFAVPGWGDLAVGSPSALGRALASEIRLHIRQSALGARVAGSSTGCR